MSAIPASIPAPQAVVELINSHCPPGFSVSSVGASVSLYRGASKTPLAAFSYTGPDSVINIVVAIWRIALAEKGPVTNITNVNGAEAASLAVEQSKGYRDALEILGWPGACDPTAWARSYLNIEQVTLAEARQESALAAEKLRTSETVRSSVSADLEQIWAAFTVAEGKDEPASASSIAEFILAQEGAKEALKSALAAEDKERARAEKAESRIRILESEATALRDSEQRAVDASVRQSKTSEDALRILGWNGEDHPEKWAHDKSRAIQDALTEARHQRDRATQHEGDIGVIAQAYFAAGFGPSPATPGGIASALDKARRRGDALRALGWDGLVDPETWARHCPTENETLAQIRGAILEALGLAKQGTGRPIIELLGELVDARDKARHYADRARMNLDDAKKWEVRVLDGFRALAFSVDPALIWPNPATLPTSMEIKALCDRAESARKGCPADKAPIGKDAYIGEVTARYESPDASPVDKEAPREPSLRTRWMALRDAAVAVATRLEDGLAGINNLSEQNLGKPATIGVRFTMEPGDGVDVARVLSTPLPTPSALFAADGDSRFKIADARRWKRGASATQDRVGRVWATHISGSCVGMTGLPFKAGRTVRFVDAADKVVLAGEVLRYEAKHLGDRLEWEAEVLHEVNVAGHDATAGAAAEKAGPRWTGITWMSAKGRAKTCRIEGLTAELEPGTKSTWLIDVPSLPPKLWRRIASGDRVALHVGAGRVLQGCALHIVQGGPQAHRLYVHASAT